MEKKNIWRVLITALVVIIGISTIGWFTWNLGGTFVSLVSANVPAEEESSEQEQTAILNLPEISFWTCQAGVFQEQENALHILDSLRSKGWKAGIISEKPYTLAIGVFTTKEEALTQSQVLTEQGIENWVRKESFPALRYKVSGSNVEKITALLSAANSLLNEKEREAVLAEIRGKGDFLFEGGCPEELKELNTFLSGVANDSQDLLDLYTIYRQITINYLK